MTARDRFADLPYRRFGVTPPDNPPLDGAMFRIVEGKKSDDDLRLDMFIGVLGAGGEYVGSWVPVKASWLFYMFDFLWENEHALYPPSTGAKGGEYLTEHMAIARDFGWQAARRRLETERRTAAERRAS